MSESLDLADPRLETMVRILAASVNARVLTYLAAERRDEPQGGWRFLSQIAEAVDEKPGTVGMAVQKLLPLLEERREKGRRYFRSQVRRLELRIDRFGDS